MFIGHFAAGMGAKRIDASVSLGTLFLASQFLDLLWPTLLLTGLEHVEINTAASEVTPLNFTHYPISHSLLVVLFWGALFGGIYYAVTRNRPGAWLLGALVVSHWILDLIVHIPDLPLFPGESPKVGLGLWNSTTLTLLVEGTLFLAGILLYTGTKKRLGEKVTWRFWSLAIFLVVIHAMNLLGPPPPNVTVIAWAGHLQWLFIPWAWWADRHTAAR